MEANNSLEEKEKEKETNKAINPLPIRVFSVPCFIHRFHHPGPITSFSDFLELFEKHLKMNEKIPGKQVVNNLPNDILMDIIINTRSVKSIARCRCVCKAWRDLLSTPYFANLHLSTSPSGILLTSLHSNNHKLRHYDLIESQKKAPFKPPDYSRSFSNQFTLESKLSDCNNELVGSCNGILIWRRRTKFGNKSTRGLYLSNPLTREYLMLSRRTLFCSDHIGFGFCPKTNQYKVIQLYSRPTIDSNKETWCGFVHTVGTSSWRKIEGDIPKINPNFGCVYLHGTLNWIAILPICKCIYSFDMETEEFKLLAHLPLDIATDNLQLRLFGDRLCICTSSYLHKLDTSFNIWVFEKKGGAVMKTITFDAWGLLFVKRFELIFMKVMENGGMFFVVHHDMLSFREDTVIAHVPSFISLKDIVRRKVIKGEYKSMHSCY